MSDDWKPGDLALCVNASGGPKRIRQGGIYTVVGIGAPRRHMFFGLCRALHLDECRSVICGYAEPRFRKINPLTNEEREQFLEQIKKDSHVTA